MADSFGLKIGLEGEKEFKKALAEINQSFKVLGSEMKLATSQFDKNDKSVEALAARNKVLRKEIDEQTTKIDTLRKALQNAATSFGENDRRTQNWQIQLNNAEAALNDMNRELDENEKAIKDGGKAAEESGSKFEGFGKVLKTVGVALGAVAVAAGAAAVKLGKEVIAAYADYEQLVGGVDTPTLTEDEIKELFLRVANQVIDQKEQFIVIYEQVLSRSLDTTALESELSDLEAEINVAAELIEECIKENAHVVLDQDEYQKRYDALVARFDKAKARHTEVTDLIAERMARKHQIEAYLKNLRSREPLTEFRETDWLAMVDYITVHSKNDIRVTLKDGTEIKA